MSTDDSDSTSPDVDLNLFGHIERLADDVAGLRRDFDAKIQYDEVKERQIAAMHDELQTLRAGLHLRLLQPMFTDLIAMHDDLAEALRAADPEQDDGPAAPAAKILMTFMDTILDTLLRNGVSSYSVESDELDLSRQRVINAMDTADQELDRRVARRLRVGFEYDGGKVLRPEWVVVRRYRETDEPA